MFVLHHIQYLLKLYRVVVEGEGGGMVKAVGLT